MKLSDGLTDELLRGWRELTVLGSLAHPERKFLDVVDALLALRTYVAQLEAERIGYVKSIDAHWKENIALRAENEWLLRGAPRKNPRSAKE